MSATARDLYRRVFVLLCAAALAGFMGCGGDSAPAVPEGTGEADTGKVASGPAAEYPDHRLTYPTALLWAGKHHQVGVMYVWTDEDFLYVQYDLSVSSVCLDKGWSTRLAVVSAPEDFPTNRNGHPRIGWFEYGGTHGPGTEVVTYKIPLEEFGGAEKVFIAAHAVVALAGEDDGCDDECEWETVWARPECPDLVTLFGRRGGWASYFEYAL